MAERGQRSSVVEQLFRKNQGLNAVPPDTSGTIRRSEMALLICSVNPSEQLVAGPRDGPLVSTVGLARMAAEKNGEVALGSSPKPKETRRP